CGPNGFLHQGLGVDPHCDCDPGYVDVDMYCISSQALSEAAGENASTPPNDSPTLPPSNVVRLLPRSCYAGPSPCEPRTGQGCAAGETCDFSGEGQLVCYPPPNEAQIGEPCDNQVGPYCASGGWCWRDPDGNASCHEVCCANSECTDPDFSCVPTFNNSAFGTLGVCRVPTEPTDPVDAPSCLSPGAFCSMATDQCCGFCHFDHCH
ncbi:MAG: hypothetical protein AAF658_11775, partial [Myxococcota bacterium]